VGFIWGAPPLLSSLLSLLFFYSLVALTGYSNNNKSIADDIQQSRVKSQEPRAEEREANKLTSCAYYHTQSA